MSNGKGVVPENPSFDGLGGYLGLALKLGFKAARPPECESLPFGGADVRFRAEATYARVDEESSAGGAVALDLPLIQAAKLRVQLAGSVASLVDDDIWEAGSWTLGWNGPGRLRRG